MTPDIEARIAADFALVEREEAKGYLQFLDEELGNDNSRVLRCVLFLAGGVLSKLVYYADRARYDYRDVIYWAEYDKEDRHVRDLNRPFESF